MTRVFANLSIPKHALSTVASGADGVGLLRAEFLVYQAGRHPLLLLGDAGPAGLHALLVDGMRKVASAFHPRPVLYRSLDLVSSELRPMIGGDLFERPEENPAMGCRGVARSRRDADVFAVELNALAQVRAEGLSSIQLMLPFVRSPEEVRWAEQQAARCGLRRRDGWQLWMMVETPATVLRADEFARLVDGVSIGSNDLVQLVVGAARDSHAFARHDWDQDSTALAAIEWAIAGYSGRGVEVGICGDAPSRSEAVLRRILALRPDHVSVSPDRIAPTRDLATGGPLADAAPL